MPGSVGCSLSGKPSDTLRSGNYRPIANLIAQEATRVLDTEISVDVMQPLQAFDAGGRARTVNAIVEALAVAKQAGVDPEQALGLVNWGQD